MDLPVVGGNVSLYNSSGGRDIDPTPVVTTLGMIDDLSAVPPGMALSDGDTVVVLGSFVDGLAGSRWAWDQGLKGGRVPEPNLAMVRVLADLVRSLVAEGLVTATHDVSEGGLRWHWPRWLWPGGSAWKSMPTRIPPWLTPSVDGLGRRPAAWW